VVTRLIADIADPVIRRLLMLAEETLGPAPVPYLWLACGSQGRQEETGVSDQGNCLILNDAVTDADRDGYFAQMAKIVCDGLDACGYIYALQGPLSKVNTRARLEAGIHAGVLSKSGGRHAVDPHPCRRA